MTDINELNLLMFIQKPAYQALLFLLLTPILLFIVRPKSADTAWVIAALTFAGFLLVNTGLLWFDERHWRYFFISIGCSIGYLLLISVLMQGMERVLKFEGSGESGMAFLIIIYHPVALLLVMVVKWIIGKWF